MKYAIMVRNRGMWGHTDYCKRNGNIELYDTETKAQKAADEYNRSGERINNFNHYFVTKYETDDDFENDRYRTMKNSAPKWFI